MSFTKLDESAAQFEPNYEGSTPSMKLAHTNEVIGCVGVLLRCKIRDVGPKRT